MAKKEKIEFELPRLDEYFTTQEERDEAKLKKIYDIPIDEIDNFPDHPFKVLDDDRMKDTADSIREYGVLVPAIARPRPDGGYELIAGHRRKRGCELAGLKTMPVIVRELDDDASIIIMVDSNIQREEILPSEKAFAFKMKMDAISHMGKKGDRSREIVGEDNGLGGRQVTRYVKLTNLIAELLDMVDQKKLTITLAVKIADLSEEKQKEVLDYINQGYSINDEQIKRIREMNKESKEQISDVVGNIDSKPRKKKKVILPENKLEKYFPEEYSRKDIEKIIYQLLEKWKSEGYGI